IKPVVIEVERTVDKPVVPASVEKEVEKKTGRLQWVTGLIGSGGLGLGWLAGMNWDAIVAGGAVVIIMLLIFLLLRRQIVSAVKDIREGLVRRQNIWHNSRRKLAECGPRPGG